MHITPILNILWAQLEPFSVQPQKIIKRKKGISYRIGITIVLAKILATSEVFEKREIKIRLLEII